MPEPTDANAGYDGFLDALAAGEGFYLACPNGHGSLPPRRACPRCGAPDLQETPLVDTGTVETATVVHVPTPQLADDVPYVTAIAGFGPVRLSGFLREVAPAEDHVGRTVRATVGTTETEGERAVVLAPTG